MQVLVCGGRGVGYVPPESTGSTAALEMSRASFERKFVVGYLSKIHEETPITLVIAGAEGGPGSISLNWANVNNVPAMRWRRERVPKLSLFSPLATIGISKRSRDYSMETFEDRNARMLNGSQPDLVLAFGGGEATKLLVDSARKKGLTVVEIDIPDFSEAPG